MAKAVVYAILAAAFVVVLVMGPSNRHHRRHGHPLVLNRRLGNKIHAPIFDPLVADIERRTEKKESSKGHGNADPAICASTSNFSADAEVKADESEQFGYEEKLNITLRLVILFPLLDKAPHDGVVSPSELNSWVRELAVERLNYRARKELESHDRDGDRTISFKEYLPQFSYEDIEKNNTSHGQAGWWKQQFVNADADGNGLLSFDEFKDLLHPEDSDNEEIKKWLMREKIESMDDDRNGKLNFVEFAQHAYDIYKNYIEYETAGAQVIPAQHKFLELDLNKDKLLDVEELLPILKYLHPGELSYAKFYASYLITEADDNKDGNLSLEEMLNHEYVFYSTVYNSNDDNDDFDEDYHDEL